MADEQTTQADTTTSQTDAPAADAVAADAPKTDAAADEGTALGGDTTADAPDADAASEEVAAGPPEKYEVSLEGTEIDAEAFAEAEPLLREANLSNEQAQTIMPAALKLVERTQEKTLTALTEAAAEQRRDWLTISKADKEIGGAKFDESLALAAKGMDALGFADGHPFRTALNETGFGNHRDMIFAFRTLGELVGEDGVFVRGNTSEKEADRVSEMYPNNRRSK